MKIVAKALIENSEGKVLVLSRSATHPLYANHLDFPGGEVDIDELSIDGVVREIFEETGLSIKREDLSLFIQNNRNSHESYEAYSVTTNDVSPVITLSWEHSTYRTFYL